MASKCWWDYSELGELEVFIIQSIHSPCVLFKYHGEYVAFYANRFSISRSLGAALSALEREIIMERLTNESRNA
mgnify:FL=1